MQDSGPALVKSEFLGDGGNPCFLQNVLDFILNVLIVKTGRESQNMSTDYLFAASGVYR